MPVIILHIVGRTVENVMLWFICSYLHVYSGSNSYPGIQESDSMGADDFDTCSDWTSVSQRPINVNAFLSTHPNSDKSSMFSEATPPPTGFGDLPGYALRAKY